MVQGFKNIPGAARIFENQQYARCRFFPFIARLLKKQQRTRRNQRKTKQRWLGPRLPFSFAFTIFATFAFALSFAAPGGWGLLAFVAVEKGWHFGNLDALKPTIGRNTLCLVYLVSIYFLMRYLISCPTQTSFRSRKSHTIQVCKKLVDQILKTNSRLQLQKMDNLFTKSRHFPYLKMVDFSMAI